MYGVSDYYPIGNSPNDLTYPDDDPDDIAALLTAQGYDVIARTNEAATREQLEAESSIDIPDRQAIVTSAAGERSVRECGDRSGGEQVLLRRRRVPDSRERHAVDFVLFRAD